MFPSLGPFLAGATNVDAEKIFSEETQCLSGLAGSVFGHLLMLASFCGDLCKSTWNQNWHYLVFNKSPRSYWGWIISALYSEGKLVCCKLFHGNVIPFYVCEIIFRLVQSRLCGCGKIILTNNIAACSNPVNSQCFTLIMSYCYFVFNPPVMLLFLNRLYTGIYLFLNFCDFFLFSVKNVHAKFWQMCFGKAV